MKELLNKELEYLFFFDLVQAGVDICKIQDIAISVLTSVISINEENNSIIVDAE